MAGSMSASLEFRGDTLTLRPIRTRSSEEDGKKDTPHAADNGEDAGCRTPTSSEHKIPQALECPAAPRKAVSFKRKAASELRVLRFFEAVNGEEVEDLFRRLEDRRLDSSSSSLPAREVTKRRRSSSKGFVIHFR
ncbi:hypothetical protein SAY87_019300 [Trapa incisa]|uniref:Uncharacterized protein n=2 Tax=Trapa TaxID=22665 RepID=A0AAN7LUP2_TRANT|nr:hypothetical protein SAY87_019300 [Trapa incisa]KAK4792780.1 hypothetical protein SAY86_023215 [Trapa natans]